VVDLAVVDLAVAQVVQADKKVDNWVEEEVGLVVPEDKKVDNWVEEEVGLVDPEDKKVEEEVGVDTNVADHYLAVDPLVRLVFQGLLSESVRGWVVGTSGYAGLVSRFHRGCLIFDLHFVVFVLQGGSGLDLCVIDLHLVDCLECWAVDLVDHRLHVHANYLRTVNLDEHGIY
jgi:hypothetical protein